MPAPSSTIHAVDSAPVPSRRHRGASLVLADAVLHEPCIRPGTMVPGEVHLVGGSQQVTVDHVELTIETECGSTFMRHPVAVGVAVPAGRTRSIPFQLPLPWETPVTSHPSAVTVRLRTSACIADEMCTGGPDLVQVHPLLGYQRVLDAVQRLGYRYVGAKLSDGPLPGVRLSESFFQEFVFHPTEPDQEVLRAALVANPVGIDVVLSTVAGGRHQFSVRHRDEPQDPALVIGAWLRRSPGPIC